MAKLAKYNAVRLPDWIYITGEVLNPNGGSVAATIPSEAEIIEIAARAQDVYYSINGAFAGPASPGYIVTGSREIIGPLGNLAVLYLYSPAGGYAHIMYFRQG